MVEEIIQKYKGKDIAIVGGGYTTYDQATGQLKDYSKIHEYIWTVNGGWLTHPTSCLGFMMDDWASPAHDTDTSSRERKEYVLKNETHIPVLTTSVYDGFDCMVRYPIEDVIACVKRHYFAETVTYMVAFAILCEVKSIHFHGTDYWNCKPAERACTEHITAIAIERGIQVFANPDSHFLNNQLDDRNNHVPGFYGYLIETFPYELKREKNLCYIDKESNRESEIKAFQKHFLENQHGV